MTKQIFLFLLSFCLSSAIFSQINYQDRINQLHTNINKYFFIPSTGLYRETTDTLKNDHLSSYLWPLCALVQAANEMETLQPQKAYLKPIMAAVQQYYNDAPPAAGYQAIVASRGKDTRYYDDNQWIGIACMDAYERTKEPTYLHTAETIYKFMMTGYDTATGGGIYWREGDFSSKNTCSNGPAILLALHLYKLTHKTEYLKTALDIYAWTNRYLLSPNNIYYDAIHIKDRKIDTKTYTYNTGTMLQANVLLYTLTHDKTYLTAAKTIAASAKEYFFKSDKLPDNYWFNAVLLRGYMELYAVEKDKKLVDFFVKDGERIWQNERNEKGLIGAHAAKSLIDQAAMIEIYARLQQLQNANQLSVNEW